MTTETLHPTTPTADLPSPVVSLLAAGRQFYVERANLLNEDVERTRREIIEGAIKSLSDQPGFDATLLAYLTSAEHNFDAATAVVTLHLPGCEPIQFTLSRRANTREWKWVRKSESVLGEFVEGGFRVQLHGWHRPIALNSLAVAANAARDAYLAARGLAPKPLAIGVATDLSSPEGRAAHAAVTAAEAAYATEAAYTAATVGPQPPGPPPSDLCDPRHQKTRPYPAASQYPRPRGV